ncbi:hypothetical protein [Paracoccus siganidrum]|uniref:Uncharacterized protein n=1 Tax=Paracoccus siganidrum TaxID=1276757 RepID=A0A419A8A2_9RHOB|nr:hypothetical protein [Paracoccus siganidrum]RJL18230.1 hypothetical protein D3P05_07770 [Paracoccus siganidrum]RMC33407.1 hypothetical protein C9E82_13230 [Paracoccus siganidrum]
MTVVPSLSPCPFCGSHLMLLGPSRAQHPPADCILSGREIAAREVREWNKRAVGAEACQLCSCTAEDADWRRWKLGERIEVLARERGVTRERMRHRLERFDAGVDTVQMQEALRIISISPELIHLSPEQQHERCVAIARAALAKGGGE